MKPHQTGAQRHRKTLQLCKQIERALSLALGDSACDVLVALHVASVQPAPNAGRLLVRVCSFDPDITSGDAMDALDAAKHRLRSDIAAAIHRKKTPELLFQFVAPGF